MTDTPRPRRRTVLKGSVAGAAMAGGLAGPTAFAAPASRSGSASGDPGAELNLVFLLDGLRPDSVTPEDTPSIHRLRQDGVNFTSAHSVVPTVTGVNAAALGTGMHPGSNGIVGNELYVPEVNPTAAIDTTPPSMLELEDVTGTVLLTDTASDILARDGKRLVSIGNTRGPFLVNPTSRHGTGVQISTASPESGWPLAFPEEIADEILNRFGPPPSGDANAGVDYSATLVNDYILTDLNPDVLLFWMYPPDGFHHDFGVGSPEGLKAIRNDDRNIGLVLSRIDELGLADRTNVFVVSDHGFSLTTFLVNLEDELMAAGLKAGPDSDDVVVASTSTALVYVKNRDPRRIQDIVEFVQDQEWAGETYTAARRPRDGRYRPVDGELITKGWVDGTFSLEVINQANSERGADIVVTFPWDSGPNEFGVPGSGYRVTGSGQTGPTTGPGSHHGSFSPYDITNTLIASGPDVKQGVTSAVPAGVIDVMPTILSLTGVGGAGFDGRVLEEALVGGPSPDQVRTQTQVVRTRAPGARYASALQYSVVGDTRYIDKSWRLR